MKVCGSKHVHIRKRFGPWPLLIDIYLWMSSTRSSLKVKTFVLMTAGLIQTSLLQAPAVLYCQVCSSISPENGAVLTPLHYCRGSSGCRRPGDALHTVLTAARLSWCRSIGSGESPSSSSCSAARTRTYSGRRLEPCEIWSSRIQPTR